MKIVLVHDWLRVNAGSEKVVGALLDLYAQDDITVFTLFNFLSPADAEEILKSKSVRISPLQYFPLIAGYYRYLLPLMPWMIRRFYVGSDHDFVLSSSHAVAKGFRKDTKVLHICYCHTPMRYAWDLYEDYYRQSRISHPLSFIGAFFYHRFVRYIRRWDLRTAANVDYFIANSENVRQRIEQHYNRSAKVIYPPVRTDIFQLSVQPRKAYYLSVGRFVPYKKMDVIVRAFQHMPDRQLLLIGDGYDVPRIRRMLKNIPNITWLGYQDDMALVRYMQEAKACIFAAKEDFGIMCVEAQACGTPVLVLKNGGYLETVQDGVSGYFFEQQTTESIVQAVARFEEAPLRDHTRISELATRFSAARFHREMQDYVRHCIDDFRHRKNHTKETIG